MKYIKRKSAVKPITGNIVDTTNIDDKTTNTYSARVIDEMNTYSTEEKVVGIWIDGKPIYRKVVYFGALPNATSKTVNHNISNLDILINSYGFGKRSDDYYFSVFYPNTKVEQSIRMLINSTTIEINTASIDRSNIYVYVILEYTKTTD